MACEDCDGMAAAADSLQQDTYEMLDRIQSLETALAASGKAREEAEEERDNYKRWMAEDTRDIAEEEERADRAESSLAALQEENVRLREMETTVKTFLHDLDEHDNDETMPKVLMSNGMWMQVAAFRKLVG